jgi:hypothetical protein
MQVAETQIYQDARAKKRHNRHDLTLGRGTALEIWSAPTWRSFETYLSVIDQSNLGQRNDDQPRKSYFTSPTPKL